ncbi:MAG: hypothetical protein HY706_08970 [Candidatus Hydrogenedentes bacterium]|nr:hypothetical protein [Candidatus Hydrogenedentota bacterium]
MAFAEFVSKSRVHGIFVLVGVVACVSPAPAAEGTVDPSTLTGKAMCGYQGWFMAPGDGNPESVGWRHWSRSTTSIGPGLYTVEMWPDVREYTAGELFTAEGVTLQDGTTGKLFSSITPSTVDLHFRWMKEYGIDGVFLQRFVSELGDPRFFEIRNRVLRNVRDAANTHGRVFALEYDTSGTSPANLIAAITEDWKYLMEEEGLLDDPRYLHHNGKPVVVIWGLGFEGRGYTPAQAQQVIDFFKSDPDYGGNLVIGGVPTFWRTLTADSESDPGWADVYRSWDIINPWMVGRVASTTDIINFVSNVWAPDLEETRSLGIGYLPVVFPGFSWDNLMQLPPGTSLIPRRGGSFLWRQVYSWQSLGVDMMFVAMFDEVDEGTAIFKVSPNYPITDHWVDYEGYPTDWYLRIAREIGRMLRGEISLTTTIPVDSDGDGTPDVSDTDDDDDGLTDQAEVNGSTGYITDPWDSDTDDDGMPDGWEVTGGLNPLANDAESDADADGLSNLQEYGRGTKPNDTDSENDGMPDGWEVQMGFDPVINDANEDADSDGLTNVDEYRNGTDPTKQDSDNDGMPDGWEVAGGLNALVNDAESDADSDGLSNIEEYGRGTQPNDTDSDNDGMPDGWEVSNALNPTVSDGANDADSDGLHNLGEYLAGTNPGNPDSDLDGMPDGWEAANGLDPLRDDRQEDPDQDALRNLDEFLESTEPFDPDTDDDLMPDGYEVTNNLNPLLDDADGDADGDTFSNYREFVEGTDPNDPESFPESEPEDIDTDGVVNAVDVQLVINAALGLSVEFNSDVDRNNQVDAVDVQLVINAALGL